MGAATPPDGSPPPAERATPPMRGSVLYIEDTALNYELVEAAFAAHGELRIANAHTGREGVQMARRDKPDVILLDMHLPDISGTEVVRMLNEDIAAGRFRVILLTGDPLNIDVLKAMSLGASQYLRKPVDLHALEAALRRALLVPRRPPAKGGSAARPSLR
ncbi:MAG: response regulator [Rubrivivax sp.]